MSVLKDLENGKNYDFNIEGVVAAQTPEASQRTHEVLTEICEVIMDAFRVFHDMHKSSQEKREVIEKIVNLQEGFDWLVNFTRDESYAGRLYPSIQLDMENASRSVENCVNRLAKEFQGNFWEDGASFGSVFEGILKILQEMTVFMKLGHQLEIAKVIDMGKIASGEANNLNNLKEKHLLVNQAKLLTMRSNEFLQSTVNLVKIQEHRNIPLQTRVDNVEMLLHLALPTFIIAVKESILQTNSDNDKQEAYVDVKACLDEIKKIVAHIKAEYDSSFKEEAIRADTGVDGLGPIVNNLLKEIAKLRTIPNDRPEEKEEVASEIPKLAKMALTEAEKFGATPEDKKEFIDNVKKARDGNDSDFFEASQKLVDLADKIHKYGPKIELLPTVAEFEAEKQMDLLEIAQQMCNALKNMSNTLDF